MASGRVGGGAMVGRWVNSKEVGSGREQVSSSDTQQAVLVSSLPPPPLTDGTEIITEEKKGGEINKQGTSTTRTSEARCSDQISPSTRSIDSTNLLHCSGFSEIPFFPGFIVSVFLSR